MCNRKIVVVLFVLLLFPTFSYSQKEIYDASQIQNQLDIIQSELVLQFELFENIEKKIDQLEDLEIYDEQKSLIMTSLISNAAISSICEYEVNLGSVFIEMTYKNSQLYSAVRIESIKNAIQQIRSIQKLIQITNSLLVLDKSYNKLMVKQKRAIENIISILSKNIYILEKQ